MAPRSTRKWLMILSVFAVTGLNVAVFAFFALWNIADSAAMSRMESDSSMDPGQLLPNSNLFWVSAHASVLMVIIVDVMAVVWSVRMAGVLQRAA